MTMASFAFRIGGAQNNNNKSPEFWTIFSRLWEPASQPRHESRGTINGLQIGTERWTEAISSSSGKETGWRDEVCFIEDTRDRRKEEEEEGVVVVVVRLPITGEESQKGQMPNQSRRG
jgi:hypothetical protein